MISARPFLALVGLALAAAACGDDAPTSAAGDPSIAITSPADGATVASPVKVQMSATDFTIEPAGEVHDDAGHFHLLVDVGCMAVGESIPVETAGFNHYGKAQMEAELELEPGQHRICLQAGDGSHKALDLKDEITVTVQ